jgi:hypothetical protein
MAVKQGPAPTGTPTGSTSSVSSNALELGMNAPERKWRKVADKQFNKFNKIYKKETCFQLFSVRNVILVLFVLQGLV